MPIVYRIQDLNNKYMTRTSYNYADALDICHDLNKRRPDARFTVRKGDIYAG